MTTAKSSLKEFVRELTYGDFTLSSILESQKNRSTSASPKSQIEHLRAWIGTGSIIKPAAQEKEELNGE